MSAKVATGCSASRIFVAADLHFGDQTLCGANRRPFADALEMDREIIKRWNATVTDHDVTYILGDVGRGRNGLTVRELRGVKHLVAGNCDDVVLLSKSGIFASVTVAKRLPRVILSHLPIHPSQLGRGDVNVHGHLHDRALDDRRYCCVSIERTNFAPVLLVTLLRENAQQALF